MEKYAVDFLGCFSTPVPKEVFIQHITELFNIGYDRTTTYLSMLNKLKDKCQDINKKNAVQEFIDFQEKDMNQLIIPEDDEDGDGFAAFNIRKIK